MKVLLFHTHTHTKKNNCERLFRKWHEALKIWTCCWKPEIIPPLFDSFTTADLCLEPGIKTAPGHPSLSDFTQTHGMESTDWHVKVWMHRPEPAGVKGNNWADRLLRKVTTTGGLCPRWSKVLRSLRRYLQTQSQAHYTISCLEERRRKRKGSTIFLEKRIFSPFQGKLSSTSSFCQAWDQRWISLKGNTGETTARHETSAGSV